MRLKGTTGAVRRSRRFRREMTLPELIHWRPLQAHPGDFNFRRQQPAGGYSLDFSCPRRDLLSRSMARSTGAVTSPSAMPLGTRGSRRGDIAIRVPAADVLRDLDAVIRMIVAAAGR